MNIKGLQAYSAIMTQGSLTAAAKHLNVSVPALSRRLAQFEAELGLKLFRRANQRLIPTEQGEAFFAESSRLLNSLDQIPAIVADIKRGFRSRLRMVLMPRLSQAIGIPALGQFMMERPEVDVHVDLEVWRTIELPFASKQFDIGLGALPARHKLLETESLGRIPLVAAMHPDHPLASRDRVSALDLAKEPLILMPSTTWIGRQSLQIFFASGVEPTIVAQVSQMQSCCDLAAEGGGIAIADALSAMQLASSMVSVPIDATLDVEIGLILPRGSERPAKVNRLAEIIRVQSQKALLKIGT
ncbi:LysR family transcriptional regulator [Nioella sp.]|uniref:LysR family transcriptional regulator n=1 Tax=Nioella sp. TaxID=1912091 RepID=UPI003A8BA6E6